MEKKAKKLGQKINATKNQNGYLHVSEYVECLKLIEQQFYNTANNITTGHARVISNRDIKQNKKD